jgi:hypothetical protein
MAYYEPPTQKYRINSNHVKVVSRPIINPNMLTGADYDHFSFKVAHNFQTITTVNIFCGRVIINSVCGGLSFDLDKLE